MSGSQTPVYPISVGYVHHSVRIELQWDCSKNIFNKFIQKAVRDNAGLIVTGIFNPNDGSCPATISFYTRPEF